MGRIDERMKASDVFRESNFVFGRKVPFSEAFPEIADLRVEVEMGVKRHGNPQRVYTLRNLPGEYIDCNESLCYNGGFSIGEILRDMVSAGETERKENRICKGYHGSPKGRRKYKDCLNFFQIQVQIQYKDQQELEDAS